MKTLAAILILFATTFSSAQALEDAPTPHKFLDKTNSFTLAAAAVSIGMDGLSTQEFQRWGHPELNPIAKPFVRTRLGDGLYFGASYATVVGLTYAAHRRGWHRVERWIPVAVTVTESAWVIRNYRLREQPPMKYTVVPAPITAGIDEVSR
ncbi:MAG TPA: hypothetical protein VFB79_23840 [Candidatus Angelobacter sp.]|nr:hypothetical protein [Candidatus Angelobacter sp.]